MQESVYIIILNYKNYEETMNCIGHIPSSGKYEQHIIVVDNNSGKDCIEHLEKTLDESVVLIKSYENRGYAAGNNIGIKYAVEKGADYIFVLNNDVEMDEDTIPVCINTLEKDRSIGILGPTILDYHTDTIQSAGAFIDYTKISAPNNNRGDKYSPLPKMCECDYVGGACLVFRGELVGSIGYMPENYFLFWEETEWCHRARAAGYKVVCTSECSVQHKGSVTINRTSGMSEYYMERNRIIFSRRCNSIGRYLYSAAYLVFASLYSGIFHDRHALFRTKCYLHGIFNVDAMKKCHD